MADADRTAALELLARLGRSPLGQRLVLAGSSGLFAASESIPALTEDLDLLVDAEWLAGAEEQVVDELARQGLRHQPETCTFVAADGSSLDLVGYSECDRTDRIGGGERVRVMVFADLSHLLASPEAVVELPGGGRALSAAALAASKLLTVRVEKGGKDKLQALLLVADSYFRQGGTTGYTEARFRYRDYLNRYPGAPQRDYSRYQFALCYDKEHEKADRDQTSTREALQQYRVLLQEFPNSTYVTVALERIRRLTDALADHEFGVGYFYIRKGAPAAALGRFTAIEQRFPEYAAKDKLFY